MENRSLWHLLHNPRAWLLLALALPFALPSPSSVRAGQTRALPIAPHLLSCQSVHRGGTFTYAVDLDVTGFDPSMTQDNGSLWADLNVYDQLVRLSTDAKRLEPDLARSWDVRQGGRVIIFHLRRNARFWDGTPVTAQDVKFSYDHVRSPKAVVNWTLEAVQSDQVLDPYTFKVILKKPWGPFLNDITLWGASILSRKAVLREGARYKSHPVGSGPFYVAKWLPGQYVLLKRNKYYWERDACGHQYPYLNTVKLQYLPNDNTRMIQLQASTVDAAIDVPYNLLDVVNKMPRLRAVTNPQMGQISIELNQKSAPLRDVKVRQAMNYAIDRNAIIHAVFFGHARPALSPVLIGNYFYTKKYGYTYNLAKAKRLMKASKFPRGFKTSVLTLAGDSIAAGIAVVMQNELRKIGIELAIRPLDSTTQFSVQQKGKFQTSYLYLTADNLDPNSNMLYCCVADGGANAGYTSWKDVEIDHVFRQTQTAVNLSQRARLYDRWQRLVMERGPYIWLVDPSNRFAYHTNVHNFFVQSTAHWPLWIVWKS